MVGRGDKMVYVAAARSGGMDRGATFFNYANKFGEWECVLLVWCYSVWINDDAWVEDTLVVVDRCSVVTRDDAICRVRYSKYIIITN